MVGNEEAPRGAGLLDSDSWRVRRLKLAFWISYRIFRVPVDVKPGYLR